MVEGSGVVWGGCEWEEDDGVRVGGVRMCGVVGWGRNRTEESLWKCSLWLSLEADEQFL